MADYDVGVIALAVPPATASVGTYVPAATVKNFGIHPADVSGLLRIYDLATGTLIATHSLASAAAIPAGDTAAVPSSSSWVITDADIGKTLSVVIYVTTPGDQYAPNNHLSATVTITAAPAPPAPPVTLHAAQHEHDGADAINVDGLAGELAQKQVPTAHASTHQFAGNDVLNVGGLAGVLSDPQPPAEHSNECHTPDFATATALASHIAGSPAHSAATNLEQTANKGAASGYAPLGADSRLPWANATTALLRFLGQHFVYVQDTLAAGAMVEVATIPFVSPPDAAALAALASVNFLFAAPIANPDVEAWIRVTDLAGPHDGNRAGFYLGTPATHRQHLTPIHFTMTSGSELSVSLVLRNASTEPCTYEFLGLLVLGVK